MRQYLEQRMYASVQTEESLRVYQVGDLENLSASALYTPKITGSKVVIPYGNLGIPELKDLHDTFRYDRYGNLDQGHTTFDTDFHISIDPLRPKGDDILKK